MLTSLHSSTKQKRLRRIRAKLFGTSARPRLSVSRSNRFLYAQLIDDQAKKTLLGKNSRSIKEKGTKTQKSALLGEALAKLALKKGISTAIFDRRINKYHGRLKALADAAREAGLKI